jgi:hypothetical protein
MNIAISSPERGGAFCRFPAAARLSAAAMLGLLAARAIFKASGLLEELPAPLVVMLAIGCAGTFAMWLIWLS